MKSLKFKFVLLAFCILSIISCTKSVTPSGVIPNVKDNYDTASFNYVYVEAIKQKLLGNGGEALKYFEQCIKINPKSDAVYYEMAQIVIENGDMNNGKKYAIKKL